MPTAPSSGGFADAAPALLAELLDSANARDVDRQMALFEHSPALTFVFSGQVIVGWDALAARQREAWSGSGTTGTYAYDGPPIVRTASDDIGVTVATLSLASMHADGSTTRHTLVQTALWRRGADGWRIVAAHESIRP